MEERAEVESTAAADANASTLTAAIEAMEATTTTTVDEEQVSAVVVNSESESDLAAVATSDDRTQNAKATDKRRRQRQRRIRPYQPCSHPISNKSYYHRRCSNPDEKRPVVVKYHDGCIVPGCGVKGGQGITLFTIPNDTFEPERRAAWFRNIGLFRQRNDPRYTRVGAKVCSQHFPDHCFKSYTGDRPRLLVRDAVPDNVQLQSGSSVSGGVRTARSRRGVADEFEEETSADKEQNNNDKQRSRREPRSAVYINPKAGRLDPRTRRQLIVKGKRPRRPVVPYQACRDPKDVRAFRQKPYHIIQRNRVRKEERRIKTKYWCVVPGCRVNGSQEGITLFAFPDRAHEPERRAAWFRNIGLEKQQRVKIFNSDHAKVCRLHFPHRCLTGFVDGRPTRLVDGACPVVVKQKDESESESDDDDDRGVSSGGFGAISVKEENEDVGEYQQESSKMPSASVLLFDPFGNKPVSISDKPYAGMRAKNWCVVPGCGVISGKGITLFSFPDPRLEPKRRAAWFRNIGLWKHQHAKIFNSDRAKVCRLHFPDDCLTGFVGDRPTRLIDGAIPFVVEQQVGLTSGSESYEMLTDDDPGVIEEEQELPRLFVEHTYVRSFGEIEPRKNGEKSISRRPSSRRGGKHSPRYRCIVPGCDVESGQGVDLFSFPDPLFEPIRRAAWIRNICLGQLEAARLTKTSKVCILHFPDECILNYADCATDQPYRLTHCAVPIAQVVKQTNVVNKEEEEPRIKEEIVETNAREYNNDNKTGVELILSESGTGAIGYSSPALSGYRISPVFCKREIDEEENDTSASDEAYQPTFAE